MEFEFGGTDVMGEGIPGVGAGDRERLMDWESAEPAAYRAPRAAGNASMPNSKREVFTLCFVAPALVGENRRRSARAAGSSAGTCAPSVKAERAEPITSSS
jgi:hypothetical protein